MDRLQPPPDPFARPRPPPTRPRCHMARPPGAADAPPWRSGPALRPPPVLRAPPGWAALPEPLRALVLDSKTAACDAAALRAAHVAVFGREPGQPRPPPPAWHAPPPRQPPPAPPAHLAPPPLWLPRPPPLFPPPLAHALTDHFPPPQRPPYLPPLGAIGRSRTWPTVATRNTAPDPGPASAPATLRRHAPYRKDRPKKDRRAPEKGTEGGAAAEPAQPGEQGGDVVRAAEAMMGLKESPQDVPAGRFG
ncbi:hypothetical protein DFJ74DRAFT_767751 [Hyaloraphidium curvatum]|nr:hypothetical protein DFJ74DRAFT_767751 [Hyaloraphidium curvatum]